MRRVHGREVAHLWANQSCEAASNNNKQFYFEGDTIYSYGPHFPIARHVKTRDGSPAILFTTDSRSTTTAKHMSFVRSALSHSQWGNVFLVKHVRGEDVQTKHDNFEGYRAQLEAAIRDAAKARVATTKARTAQRVASLVEQANRYAQAFGLRSRLKLPADFDAHLAKVAKAARVAERRAQAQRELRERIAKEAAQDKLAAWLIGEGDHFPSVFHADGVRLRVRGETIETSRGATVPLEIGKTLFKNLAKCREAGRGVDFRAAALRPTIGDYSLDEILPDGGFVAGCHRIEWPEVARVAAQIGLI